MAPTLPPPGRIHPAREKALQGCLDKLRGWYDSKPASAPDCAVRISVGSRAVTLEPWEVQKLGAWFSDAGDASLLALVAHGSALMIKVSHDVEQLIREPAEGRTHLYALQAELMLDVAIGMALLQDAQPEVDDLVARGHALDAKGLTQFRHRLSRCIGDARMCIAESERQQAEALAPSLARSRPAAPRAASPPKGTRTAAPEPKAARPAAPAAVEGTRPEPGHGTRRRPNAASAARREGMRPVPPLSVPKVLGAMCVVALAAWLGLVQLPRMLREAPAAMTRASFRDGLPIGAVDSRAGSVFVAIPSASWEGLTERERVDLIQELGRSATRESYSGLLLRDETGRTVARWLQHRGAEVVADYELPESPPAISTAPESPTLAGSVPEGLDASEAPENTETP